MFIAGLLSLLAVRNVARPAPVTNTSNGRVQGNPHLTHDEYLGIPFGYAPRFEPPVDRAGQPFDQDPLIATAFGPACIQDGDFSNETYGSENECLNMNVWKPFPPPKEPLAVILFVPGGSWQFGEAEVTI
jgi:carboxylesterase type B